MASQMSYDLYSNNEEELNYEYSEEEEEEEEEDCDDEISSCLNDDEHTICSSIPQYDDEVYTKPLSLKKIKLRRVFTVFDKIPASSVKRKWKIYTKGILQRWRLRSFDQVFIGNCREASINKNVSSEKFIIRNGGKNDDDLKTVTNFSIIVNNDLFPLVDKSTFSFSPLDVSGSQKADHRTLDLQSYDFQWPSCPPIRSETCQTPVPETSFQMTIAQ